MSIARSLAMLSLKPFLRWSCRPAFHRTLFTLPGLPELSPWSSGTKTYHEHKIFPYEQKQLYDIVADIDSYPKFIPFCTGSRIVTSPCTERARDRELAPFVMEAELTVGFLTFEESYVSQVTCNPYESVQAVALSSTPLFKTLSTTWRFQPAAPQNSHPSLKSLPKNRNHEMAHCTLVTLDLEYAFTNPLHAAISSTFFGQVSELMVKAFEERCLKVYGPGRV